MKEETGITVRHQQNSEHLMRGHHMTCLWVVILHGGLRVVLSMYVQIIISLLKKGALWGAASLLPDSEMKPQYLEGYRQTLREKEDNGGSNSVNKKQ